MADVRASAVRWHSHDFPGWLELSVRDADGREHRIVEKAPVLTADSPLPAELWIKAAAEATTGGEVVVTFAHGIQTVDGAASLVVSPADVRFNA